MNTHIEPATLLRGEGIRMLQRVLCIAVVVFAAASQMTDTDIWWHMASGRAMIEETTVDGGDALSYTAIPASARIWLYDLLTYSIARVAGPAGIVIAKISLIIISLFLLLRLVRARVSHRYISLAVFFWTVLVVGPLSNIRPEIFTLFFTVILLIWLREYFSSGARYLYVAPLLFLGWASLDTGVATGLVVLSIPLVAEAVKRIWRLFDEQATWRLNDRSMLLPLILILVACSLVVAWRGPSAPFAPLLGGSFTGTMVSPIEFPPYGLLLLAAAIILFMNAPSMKPLDSVTLVIWGLLSLKASRNVPVFAVCAAPVIAAQVSEAIPLIPSKVSSLLSRYRTWLSIAVCVVLGAGIVWAARRPGFGLSPPGIRFPVGAAAYLNEQKPSGKLFNSVEWGGYLAWRLAPGYRVFIDGRDPGRYPATLHRDYRTVKEGDEKWDSILEKYGVNIILLPNGGEFLGLVQKLREREEWRLAYWDFQSILYLRAIPEHEEILGAFEYKAFNPETEEMRYWLEPLRLQSLAEIRRYLKEFPESIKARGLLAMEEMKAGRMEAAAAEYEKILALNPGAATVHHNLALIAAARGNEEKAIGEYRRELEINPNFPPSLNNLGRIYYQRRELDQAEELFKKALEIDENYPHARSNLGIIAMERGEFDRAIAAFEAVLKINPHDRAAFNNLRMAQQMKMQKLTGAIGGERIYGPLTKDEALRSYEPSPLPLAE